MLLGLHEPTNFQIYRQNSEKHYWGPLPRPRATPVLWYHNTPNNGWLYKEDIPLAKMAGVCVGGGGGGASQLWFLSLSRYIDDFKAIERCW